MPILVRPQDTAPPPPVPRPPLPPPRQPYLPGRRLLHLTSGRGDELLLTDRDNGFRVRRGVRGLDLPPVEVQRRQGAGNGSRWQRTRWQERVIDLPLRVEAGDTETFAARKARLLEMLDDRYGAPTLTVTRPDGTARRIGVRYAGGLEGQDGASEGGPTFLQGAASFVAVDPFFEDADPVLLSISTAPGSPFIPFGAPLVTAPSRVVGELELLNNGDADAFPVWTLTGPGGPWVVDNLTDGVGFTFRGVLAAGEQVVIDTAAKTVLTGSTNRYAELAPAPRLWSLPPGRSLARVTSEGALTGSAIWLEYRPRWKTGS